MSKDIRKEFSDVIYPKMIIRSQAETIELQEKEIERLNNIIKEVREYTSKTQMPEGYKKIILEILNKGE